MMVSSEPQTDNNQPGEQENVIEEVKNDIEELKSYEIDNLGSNGKQSSKKSKNNGEDSDEGQ